jgi:hypothetical protein
MKCKTPSKYLILKRLESQHFMSPDNVALAQDGLFGPIHVQRASIRFASAEISRVDGDLVPG